MTLKYPLRSKTRRKSRHDQARSNSTAVLILAVLSLTSAIGYRFYNDPQLAAETIAPQTLRAPESARVVDVRSTENNRKAARTGSVPVLMIDESVNQEIYQSLQRLIEQGNELRQRAGAFPFVETSTLSTTTQQHLRQAAEWEWREAIAAASDPNTNANSSVPTAPQAGRSGDIPANSSQQLAIIELQNYRRITTPEDFTALKEVVARARQRYAAVVSELAHATPNEPGSFYNASLLDLTDAEWNATKASIRQALERMLSQGISPGIPNTLLKTAIAIQIGADVPSVATPLSSEILISVVKPNLVQDPEQTKLRAEQAAQAVAPEIVEVRRGEVIVQAGETISQKDFVLLDHFGMSRRGVNWFGLIGFAGITTGAVGVFLLVEYRFHPGLRRRDHLLVVLLTLTVPLTVILAVPAMSLPAVGLLVGSFYGSALGVTIVGLLSIVIPIGMEISWISLFASTIGSLVGAFMAGQLRSREELALLGGAVGITQGVAFLLLTLILSPASTPVWYVTLSTAALQSLMGVAWSVVALGISPYLENLFDLVTPIRLAELSNPNRPMLKRLASEAPGTFQHTLFVATLAEAAARALGCNVELVRAGTLYHDIGKMHDALGFIENQMGGPNKHDLIDNPWKSAEIIKKHVTEGLVMARKCRLPTAIRAFIPEHQGTMLITYFYYQAQQRAQDDPSITVKESDFRYDGPIPQSRETGIVMLADSCEAALRSLKDATPDDALAMVNRILRARWQDNQLIDSGLTRVDMSKIAEIFVQVWQQFNHQRIPYPKAALSPQPAPAQP
ncbi:HD family phosphohydrolase [Oculatella sp. LEGE 06141]|uniref:HD family phosphohydrolase n=1 Tax=Oculatella sp. LEGE 06141 TaxID=1828648 RepID=UPI001D15E2B9|nr:HDIG domain-containing metalloprotein [Oculatella sp. LEGE 06141]